MKNNHYIYKDYTKKIIIFECDANDILEADALLLDFSKIIAAKQNNIGCSITKIK